MNYNILMVITKIKINFNFRMYEMENLVIKGRPVRAYKNLPHSIRDLWMSTVVRNCYLEAIVYAGIIVTNFAFPRFFFFIFISK